MRHGIPVLTMTLFFQMSFGFVQTAGAAECLKNLGQLIFGVSKRDFKSFIDRLPKDDLLEPLSVVDTWKPVILDMEGQYFWGHLSSLSLAEKGKTLFILKDFKGQVHLWDRGHLHKAKAYLSHETFSPDSIAGIHPRGPSQGFMDQRPFLKMACEQYRAFRLLPEFRKISHILNRGPQRMWQPRLFKRYLSHCMGGGSAVGALALWSYVSLPDRPVGQHSSNFSFGLTAMVMMDQCLKSLNPRAHHKILLTTLGANTLANIYYELDIPHVRQPDFIHAYRTQTDIREVKDTSTDLLDFASGLLATVSYAYFSSWLEKTTWINRARLCR
ncbi:MAG: hypothetical protein OXB88_00810 [Bacteriovoracales bacterium]|nr:hypothetical protein [Bacteriovoracales bacterium]